jgi:hypothetical protein
MEVFTGSIPANKQTKIKNMNLYQLLSIIKQLEEEQNPANEYLLQFYNDLYQCELITIANKVIKQLDSEPNTKHWFEYLAK